MKIFVVCSNDIDERYGCYIDSVWSKRKKAETRRDELNESEAYSYEEPWNVKKIPLDENGGW